MNDHHNPFWLMLLAAVTAVAGCRSGDECRFRGSDDHFRAVATQIEYPDVDVPHRDQVLDTPAPRTVNDTTKAEYWAITLEEAVSTALANSQVIRDAGGMIMNSAAPAQTVFDPAIRDTDPRGGVEVALSAFDTQLAASMALQKSDRSWGGLWFLRDPQDIVSEGGIFEGGLQKIGAAGTVLSLTDTTMFSQTDGGRGGGEGYANLFKGQIRQPLLQGAGIEYNRIAGPNGKPGLYGGVVLARINTDLGLADFESAVIGLLNNVEKSYWDLYVAYRDLDARLAAREMALETWRNVYRRFQAGAADQEEEARSREQFYMFNSQVLNSLNGTPPPTGVSQIWSGSMNGVYALDRRLRWLLGLPPSDGKLIRPADEPSTCRVAFDWYDSLRDALCRRVELRKQKWTIKRRELELIAARNMLKVRLDAVGQYSLVDVSNELLAEQDFTGSLQQWQVGLQLATPLGNRIGHNAVRNAELLVSREKAIYRDQELRVSHELSDSTAELERSYAVSRSNLNAGLAAYQHLQEINKKYEAGVIPLEFLLDAQRRVVEANNAYYRSLIDYNEAIAAFQISRGTLLEYHQVQLAEGPWTDEAYRSAAKQARRFKPRVLNYVFEVPPAVSQGELERRPPDAPNVAPAAPMPAAESKSSEKPAPSRPAEVLPVPVPEPSPPSKKE